MRKYETVFVIDSLLKPDEIENIITKYEKFISANGGQIEIVERWGKRRLAYEIKKRQYGYYVLIRFDGLPTMIKPLEREYRLNESILRFKTILLSTMALKALEQKQARAHVIKEETKEPVSNDTPKDDAKAKPAETNAPEASEEKKQDEKVEETTTEEQTPVTKSDVE